MLLPFPEPFRLYLRAYLRFLSIRLRFLYLFASSLGSWRRCLFKSRIDIFSSFSSLNLHETKDSWSRRGCFRAFCWLFLAFPSRFVASFACPNKLRTRAIKDLPFLRFSVMFCLHWHKTVLHYLRGSFFDLKLKNRCKDQLQMKFFVAWRELPPKSFLFTSKLSTNHVTNLWGRPSKLGDSPLWPVRQNILI